MPPADAVKKAIDSVIEKEFPKESKVKIKALTTPGGYTSAVFAATISTPARQVEVFAKVVTVGEDIGGNHLFQIEDHVYSKLAPAFEELQDKHRIYEHRYVFPKYYGCYATGESGDPAMIMENLMARGYENYDSFNSFDWEYAAKSVEMLARFHALSLSYSTESLGDFLVVDKTLMMPHWKNEEQWKPMIDGAMELVDGEDREKVARCIEGRSGWSSLLEFRKPRNTKVIVHGDYRPSNLMHRKEDGKLDVIPVDYQTARVGCPTSDLVYFVVMGSDGQFREQYFHQLLDHYHEELTLALKRLGVGAEVYGREEFDAELKETLPFGMYIAAMSLPFATVAPEHAPRFDLGQFLPPRSELFARRFRDLVRDWTRWGFI